MIFRFLAGLILCVLVAGQAQAQILTGYDEPAPEPVIEPASEEPVYEAVEQPQPEPQPESLVFTPVSAQAEPAGWTPFMTAADPRDLSSSSSGSTGGQQPVSTEDAVDLDADNLVHDEATQTITASGDVFLTQAGRILRADEIIYDLKTDTAKARGHVVLNERNGDVHYSEEVEFNDQLKDGFVQGLNSYLSDGSRFTAEQGKRKSGNKTIMENAS